MSGTRGPLRRIVHTSARHPWMTIAVWIVLIVGVTLGGAQTTSIVNEEFFTNDVDSLQGQRALDANFGDLDLETETIIVQSDDLTVDDPAFKERVTAVVAAVTPLDDRIQGVTNYYDAVDAPEAQALVSEDRHALLVPVTLTGEYVDLQALWDELDGTLGPFSDEQFHVGSYGAISNGELSAMVDEDMGSHILIGLPIAAIVLLLVFRSLVAPALPILLGVVTIAAATGIGKILSGVVEVDDVAYTTVTMIGLAVGIDYSLFILERYREERRRGLEKIDAIDVSGGTAGKAVLFSGGTVILGLVGLVFMPITIFQGMGIATGVTALVAVIGAVTLLPALIALIGDKVEFPRKMRFDVTATGPQQPKGMWAKITRGVMNRPGTVGAVVAGIMLVLALPTFTIQLGQTTIESLPDSDLRSNAQLISGYFGGGNEEPLEIVIPNDDAHQDGAKLLLNTLNADERFAGATATESPNGAITVIHAVLKMEPFSVAGQETVGDLRDNLVPDAFGRASNDVYVTGAPAEIYDFDEVMADNLPVVFAFVLGTSFVLLLLAFRSVLIPLMSIGLNLLSVGAAYGAVVAVFQHGWGADLFGFTQVESIVNWLPVMLFCILFGLSMDYHVFLLSRIRESWMESHNTEKAIVVGVSSTGRIITGAALIMVAVFATFALGRLVDIQQMGFGLAIAVLLDATLIRSVLVPSIMKLMGERSWWMPHSLRWLPSLHIEGAPRVEPASAD